MEEHIPHHKKEKLVTGIPAYIDNIILVLWGIFFFVFPFVFSTFTTEAFVLPRQIILLVVSLFSLILFGAKMVMEGKTKLRRTPFDLPIILFVVFAAISTIFSVNQIDSILAFVPLLLVIFSFFVIINIIRSETSIFFLVSTFLAGAAALALLAMLSFFKLYILPFSFTHVQSFTPFGSLVEQAYYFVFLLPLAMYFAYPLLKGNTSSKSMIFSIITVLLGGGFLVTLFQLLTSQHPVFLPFETGFQTAFAAISQDANRIAEGFFFGSGYGTFGTDFTRFKQAPFNLNNSIWYLSFSQSSSFVLELLSTTGLLGILSYLFIIWRILKKSTVRSYNPLFISLVLIIIVGFFLPFSFLTFTLFFFLLALYVSTQALLRPKEFFDIELHLVTLKKGLIAMTPEDNTATAERGFTKVIPISFLVFFSLVTLLLGYFGIRFIISDITFQQSLVAASQNKGTETYTEERDAITLFPYRDMYYRIFSQTNLALANGLAQNDKDNLAKDPQAQQTLYTLIQQSITAGRNATAISPMTVANWQNLASIYRSLIGFGQNAESFSLLATQQAVALDSANPQEYIALGGLYYQLGQYDNAIREFSTAANLKPDFANAFYNLGHAYEQKGDYQSALAQYQTVLNLEAKDPTNSQRMRDEISALQAKMNTGNTNNQQPAEEPTPTPTPTAEATPEEKTTTQSDQLDLNQSDNPLPTQKPPLKIPSPAIAK